MVPRIRTARGIEARGSLRLLLPPKPSPSVENVGRTLTRQIQTRCAAKVLAAGEATRTVELAISPGIGTEGFRIEGPAWRRRADRRQRPAGDCSTARASSCARAGTIGADSRRVLGRGTSVPKKPMRGIYFATHFHNFYHDAPAKEVERYVEDLALWGYNTLVVWYDMHHFDGHDDPKAVAFRAHLHAILGAARRIGLDVGLIVIANEAYNNSPSALRADPSAPARRMVRLRGLPQQAGRHGVYPGRSRPGVGLGGRPQPALCLHLALRPGRVRLRPVPPLGEQRLSQGCRSGGRAGPPETARGEDHSLDVVFQRGGVEWVARGVCRKEALCRLHPGRRNLASDARGAADGRLSRDQHARDVSVGRLRGHAPDAPRRATMERREEGFQRRLSVLRGHLRRHDQGGDRSTLLERPAGRRDTPRVRGLRGIRPMPRTRSYRW